jgi:hypothetical protein
VLYTDEPSVTVRMDLPTDRDQPTESFTLQNAETIRFGRLHHPWAKRVRRMTLLALALCLVIAGIQLVGLLTAPGTDTTQARIAEFARDHGAGDLVTWMEKVQYQSNIPKVGGKPTGGIPLAGGVESATPKPKAKVPAGLPTPAALTPLAGGTPLPGEGQWQTVVSSSQGVPAVRVAALRPDNLHTSYVAGVIWLDPTQVRGQLRPGTIDPGGTWQAGSSLSQAEQQNVAAAFNAGFRLTNNSSHGGYYSEGRTVVPLVDGAASLVLNQNGVATVGSWNSEVRMSPSVASVRQNLVMLVDNGQVNPQCGTGGGAQWGATIGNAAYIDRSGFGVTASGAEVYVGGPALSVCTLGKILQDAGVVRGMELDINPDWITGVYYHDQAGGHAVGYQLYPGQRPSPSHYLSPSTRDWYAWFLR